MGCVFEYGYTAPEIRVAVPRYPCENEIMKAVPSKQNSFPLRLPPGIRSRVERLAEAEGISLNQFIALTLAEKLGASDERSFFAQRKTGADLEDLRGFIGRQGGEPPRAGDEVLRGVG